jgi:hypothetical protein
MFGKLGTLPQSVYEEFHNLTGIEIDDRKDKMTIVACNTNEDKVYKQSSHQCSRVLWCIEIRLVFYGTKQTRTHARTHARTNIQLAGRYATISQSSNQSISILVSNSFLQYQQSEEPPLTSRLIIDHKNKNDVLQLCQI